MLHLIIIIDKVNSLEPIKIAISLLGIQRVSMGKLTDHCDDVSHFIFQT